MTVRRPTRSFLLMGLMVGVLAAILVGTSVAGSSVSSDPASPTSSGAPTATAEPTATATATATATPSSTPPATDTAALAVLATLPVKGRAPKTGYHREGSFGSAWQDVDENGCDTRNDILARDLTVLVVDTDCEVQSGVLLGPYTGLIIDFVRGQTTSSLVQIDHVVALSNAWQTGAQQLSQKQRVALANDPLNLLAVDGVTNSRKGDGDTATWLPPLKSYRCAYVARQISVKATYALWVTTAEHDAMTRILSDCPNEIATGTDPVVVPAPAPVADTPSDVYFQNCTAAREAGAAPVHVGEPGYGRHLDRDGDGTGCE
ncbi:DUF1524 domain-containing protein [Cryobacterium sp. PH31-L1]|uniref:GmrSD restriction endonuclease domain-containing protein n=1 Tax=Cryobacterium sp. PH31-L1 TaxID=3046199 RepID=UPI0024B939D5|nr:DUF1524 domain-containing protein [Cryobacterium sp. PH31-L1]MDJ0376405.1 excalibur calcium-binding domain-containing protein [Cryobacterium sp. PH31-L1]